jgi:hypothetical protein
MEELLLKIQALRDLIKSLAPKTSNIVQPPSIPALKQPPLPSMNAKAPTATKIPGMNPSSKKDPKKVAEQLKSGKVKSAPAPVLKTDKNGQWSLE